MCIYSLPYRHMVSAGLDVFVMSDMVDKWGRDVAGRGFAQIPNYLLLLNTFVDKEDRLSPLELLLLIELIGSWWKKDELPFPSIRTLAIRCGASERQVARAMKRLEEVPLIRRQKRRTKGLISSNSYDLAPLVEMLEEVSRQYPNEFPRKAISGSKPSVE